MTNVKLFNLNLTNKYVAFLDVLGFKELVFSNKRKELETYFNTVANALKLIQDKKEIKSLSISDSIILTAPDDINQFRLLLTAIRTIQSELLKNRIILRGAISYGEVQFDEDNNIIIGKGYIRAYLLEQEAIFPRVIIDPIIIPHIANDKVEFLRIVNGNNIDDEAFFDGHRLIFEKNSCVPFSGKVGFEGDDDYFVDYASKYFIEPETIKGTVENIFEFIKNNIYGDRRNRAKYIWLKDYFKELLFLYVDDRTVPGERELYDLLRKIERL